MLFFLFLANQVFSQDQQPQWWHGTERTLHYRPDGEDFVLVTGNRRFNRALYGGNTAFRVEAGDLPEFALYLPGMGGNLQFGLIKNNSDKWLIRADSISTRYRPGSMLYEIKDDLLGKGSIRLAVLSLFDSEGLVVKMECSNIAPGTKLVTAFGGATGTRFSRDGDIGADPESSFYLKPEYCKDNRYRLDANSFTLFFGSKNNNPLNDSQLDTDQLDSLKKLMAAKTIAGLFPTGVSLHLADAHGLQSPSAFRSAVSSDAPALCAEMDLQDGVFYFLLQNNSVAGKINYAALPLLFDSTENKRKALAARIIVHTPDSFINTLGGALGMAADAIWEDPSYLHGAVAWRMRLNGWRGAYAADVLGWHDRAGKHFSSYALSQVTAPATAPVVADTALHLARHLEKMGTGLFSSGYISRNPGGELRPHHYDMNLVFIDQLLYHFQWTGDTAFMRSMWPLLQRHLAWEKRNFDADNDGLYDAYAAIWASDALQYSGGGVTHSSAYNFRANRIAAQVALLLKEDPSPYQKEAAKIEAAVNRKLWMADRGWYAEYRDLLGRQLQHPAAGLWTVYHAMESGLPDAFQAWQTLHYVDREIPAIPVRAKGLTDTSLYTLSTTNWQPYTWSLNNVVLSEVLHTALANWQGNRREEAFRLWKSNLVESMYLGASPGNFQQLSFYDAIRGELYRDFADGIGMTARSLVEGLFGIHPDALEDSFFIRPGFPADWHFASLHTPDLDFNFQRQGETDTYTLQKRLPINFSLSLSLPAIKDDIVTVLVNGRPAAWRFDNGAVGQPMLRITAPPSSNYSVVIQWKGHDIEKPSCKNAYAQGETISIVPQQAKVMQWYDPQKTLAGAIIKNGSFRAGNKKDEGNKVFFILLKQGRLQYWLPVAFSAKPKIGVSAVESKEGMVLQVVNQTAKNYQGIIRSGGFAKNIRLLPGATVSFPISNNQLVAGSNRFEFIGNGKVFSHTAVNWDVHNASTTKYEKINLTAFFNDDVRNIFREQYISPRPKSPTLQLPTQGIGNWAYPLVTAVVNDSGLRRRAGEKNELVLVQGIPFETPSAKGKNILFTSQWDVYPDSVLVPLKGQARHAYCLMAGTTNPMQSRMVNGQVVVQYRDGSSETLELKNPENWWPIEQDYYEDGFALTTGAPKPVRVYLKTGADSRQFNSFTTIRGFSNRAIDGGAATVVDLPLNPAKELKSLVIKSIANDVVIGLMSLTLVR
jgi:hypothetical protein